MHANSMANTTIAFKDTRVTSPQPITPPDNPLHKRFLPEIAEEDPLVPIRVSPPSAEHRAGLPPSKNFKISSPKKSQLRRWILLPPRPGGLANAHTHPYSLDTRTPSSPTPYQPPKFTSKRKRDQVATMPYNNTAIPPPEEITGVASLPCQSSC